MADLSRREQDILDLMWKGLAIKEIAGLLGLSPSTVKNHQQIIRLKLGVNNKMEAVRLAIEKGLIQT